MTRAYTLPNNFCLGEKLERERDEPGDAVRRRTERKEGRKGWREKIEWTWE